MLFVALHYRFHPKFSLYVLHAVYLKHAFLLVMKIVMLSKSTKSVRLIKILEADY